MSNISKEDVLSVAKSLNFQPTEEQINEVIERFDEEAENDPTGNLVLWIENLLYDIEVLQVKPIKPKAIKKDYKVWVVIEERTEFEDGSEEFKDLEDNTQSAGHFDSIEEAERQLSNINSNYEGDFRA